MIPPTPATGNENGFDFSKNVKGTKQDTRSVENLYMKHGLEDPHKGSGLLFIPKLTNSRRLSIPVVLIPADGKTDSKFNSNDNVYIENLYKAASVSSLGNFGNLVEPMPIIKNKEGKW